MYVCRQVFLCLPAKGTGNESNGTCVYMYASPYCAYAHTYGSSFVGMLGSTTIPAMMGGMANTLHTNALVGEGASVGGTPQRRFATSELFVVRCPLERNSSAF